MLYYYAIPFALTLLFAFAYLLVQIMLVLFDLLNPFWDYWDTIRKKYSILIGFEFIYFAAILYYIVYYELSGSF
ncbi:MAG: hypothetical protein BWY02_00675 [bacterium ADurb.Bin157]|jgi:hypothetical protein|nr:hypothetical protein [Candidatus Riflebacteria bacterium]MDD2623407.1 hypothetical protein [Candidatus Riflebacteria bacterium]MDD3376648.1 hypothetical protein [Candidatus Riflebacteria bacterium]OQB50334.1 MAG: hypothetical protein BWY02_00675 [bacterium ADurb.Bin157]